jgi:hypothetical protein
MVGGKFVMHAANDVGKLLTSPSPVARSGAASAPAYSSSCRC